MRLGPRQPQHIGEEPLGQSMTAHDLLGEGTALRGQRDAVVQRHQTARRHLVNHLGHGRARHLEPFGNAGLDHLEIILTQFEDRFAVFLECGMPLAGTYRLLRCHVDLREVLSRKKGTGVIDASIPNIGYKVHLSLFRRLGPPFWGQNGRRGECEGRWASSGGITDARRTDRQHRRGRRSPVLGAPV